MIEITNHLRDSLYELLVVLATNKIPVTWSSDHELISSPRISSSHSNRERFYVVLLDFQGNEVGNYVPSSDHSPDFALKKQCSHMNFMLITPKNLCGTTSPIILSDTEIQLGGLIIKFILE